MNVKDNIPCCFDDCSFVKQFEIRTYNVSSFAILSQEWFCKWVLWWLHMYFTGFPGGSDGKESACNAGDLGSISRSGIFPGEGNSNPLQDSCLGNPMDRGAWQTTIHGVTRRQTQLSNWHFHFLSMYFRIIFSSSIFKKSQWHFEKDCLDSVDPIE